MFILLLTRKRFQRSMTIPPWMIQWRKLPRSCRRCRCWFLCWFCTVGSATHHVSLDVSLDFDRIWRRMQPSRSLQRQCRVQRRQKHRIVSMEWHHKHENIIHGIVLFLLDRIRQLRHHHPPVAGPRRRGKYVFLFVRVVAALLHWC